MSNRIKTALLTVALGASAFTDPAAATMCRGGEMRMSDSTCFSNPGLAASMRERGVLMNQLKIGYFLPVVPKKDRLYPSNFDVNRVEFSQPGNFSTSPFPPSP